MRIRSIKPEFWTDRVTGRWDTEMKLVYIALWNVADDDGRFEYEPDVIRGLVFPFGCPFSLESVFARIAESGKVRLYSLDGTLYGVIPSFKDHQKPNRPTLSRLPPPPAIFNDVPAVRVVPEPSAPTPLRLTESSVSTQGVLIAGVGDGVGDGVGGGGELPLVVEANASDDAGPFARVAAVWDSVCVPVGFAKARSTPQQRKAARTRLREPGWLDAFTAACGYMAAEPFYRGGSSSGWVATLGWLLKPGNSEKTAERASTTRAPHAPANRAMAGIANSEDYNGEAPWETSHAGRA